MYVQMIGATSPTRMDTALVMMIEC